MEDWGNVSQNRRSEYGETATASISNIKYDSLLEIVLTALEKRNPLDSSGFWNAAAAQAAA